MAKYTHLSSGGSDFSAMMLNNGFGIVTVMNANIYNYEDAKSLFTKDEGFDGDFTSIANKKLCSLDTLKVANVTIEGPTKTIKGGQYANPLIKYGKTAKLEMQDALGNSRVLEALSGGINEWEIASDSSYLIPEGTGKKLPDSIFPENGTDASLKAFHYGQDFATAKTIVGDSFFIDRKTGKQVKVKIVFYQFLPDSLFNLTQDAEGDATVFDMNGDLMSEDVKICNNLGVVQTHGLFYSIFAE